MTIVKKIENKLGKIPSFMFYKDYAKITNRKYQNAFRIDNKVLDEAEELAKASQRKRFILAIHSDLKEHAHKMINTLFKGTYAPPHKHTNKNTSEELLILRGTLCLIEFSKSGNIINKIFFGQGYDSNLVEIKPNVIHTVIPVTETVTIFEVKGQDNYDPSKDKNFFDWAPKEDDDPKVIKKYIDFLEHDS
jgi:cupin fold WbuC family metalloprotein